MTKNQGFIGREDELRILRESYGKKDSQLVVLYGRRRVGKTALLTRFCKDKKHFYFTGRKGETEEKLFERFLKEVSEFLGNLIYAKVRVSDWREIFEIIDKEGKKRKGRLLIVLDEFQWLCPARGTLISSLQEQWDKKWKKDDKIFLVLCGSIVSFMEKNVLSEKSPLYGRRTLSFELGPMPPNEAKQFFPRAGFADQGEILMTFGGIPSYLELMDQKKSLPQNINSLTLIKDSYFVNEVKFVLREQLKNPNRYYLLLKLLLGKGISREKMAEAMGIANSGALNFYLKTLCNLHLIKPIVPITKKESSKSVKYVLWDEFLRFYFRFIYPNEELIQMNMDDWLYDRIIAPHWESYCGYSFELFCMKNVKTIVDVLKIKNVFGRSGTYWHAKTTRTEGVQIDMVIERTDNITHLIECKWSTGRVGTQIAEELERKKRLYPNPKGRTLKTVLITTHGVTDEARQLSAIDNVITLKEMLG